MKHYIFSGLIALSALFLMDKDSVDYYTSENIPDTNPTIIEVPTTEQLIKRTSLYRQVEKMEKHLDSIDNEKNNFRPVYRPI